MACAGREVAPEVDAFFAEQSRWTAAMMEQHADDDPLWRVARSVSPTVSIEQFYVWVFESVS